MPQSLFSPLWYRVADQHPHLRPEVRVQRQHVRDQRWYLLVNATNGQQYRVNSATFEFLGRCDGTRSVQEVWNELLAQFRDKAPTQDEVMRTLNRLDEHGLLTYDIAPDAQTMLRRRDEGVRRRLRGFVNPFALRIPLGDPSALLQRTELLARLVFNRVTLIVWLALVSAATIAAASNWNELSAHARTYMATPHYLLLAWLCFPLTKILHELGHALAVRRWGGDVHQAGFSLFALVPAPYVDASAAAAFRSRYQRITVGAAGIMIELALASIAMTVWFSVQPGTVRDIAFVTMFIASVSTVIFNGNPLLQFDAYYMMCDALELPNLSARSRTWWRRIALRAFGAAAGAEPIQFARGEWKWLLLYAPLALAYKVFVSCLLVLWAGSHSAILGGVAALLLATLLVIKPLFSMVTHALRAGAGQRMQWRRVATASAGAGVFVTALCAVPLPFHTVASGVVRPPEKAQVRAGAEGFVTRVLARDGEHVRAGQVLFVLDDPVLFTQRGRLTSRLEQLQAGRFDAMVNRSEQGENVEEEIRRVQSELQRVEEKIEQLNVRAGSDGLFVVPHQADLPDTFIQQGSVLAYVLQRGPLSVRAVVPEYDAMLVRESTRRVDVAIAGETSAARAEFVRDVPAATRELPSAALGERAGGPYATDPTDSQGLRTQEPVVVVDLKVPARELERVGGRVWVRFEHCEQPLASRWYRRARQVLLQQFNPAG